MEPMGDSVGLWSCLIMSKLCFLNYVGKAFEPVWVIMSIMYVEGL